MRRRVRLVVWTGAIVLAVYAAAAYLVAPMIWGEIERVRHAPEAMLTHTAQGIPGGGRTSPSRGRTALAPAGGTICGCG